MKLLTKQEEKISRCIAQGLIEKEIAEKLFISEHTVHTHYKNIRKKLGAKNIADITRIYILSLARPMDVFKVVCAAFFLSLQVHIVLFDADMDLRRVKTSVKVLRVKTKIKDAD